MIIMIIIIFDYNHYYSLIFDIDVFLSELLLSQLTKRLCAQKAYAAYSDFISIANEAVESQVYFRPVTSLGVFYMHNNCISLTIFKSVDGSTSALTTLCKSRCVDCSVHEVNIIMFI